MKKIFIISISIIFFSKIVLAEEPDYSLSLNENINKHGWKVKSSKFSKMGETPIEIYTLINNGFILKCFIRYYPSNTASYCELP